MILFNTTFLVHPSVDDEFHRWVKTVFIPEAVESGVFLEPMLSRILGVEADGNSYALQFKSQSLRDAEQWNVTTGDKLKGALFVRHGEKMLSFCTFMEVL